VFSLYPSDIKNLLEVAQIDGSIPSLATTTITPRRGVQRRSNQSLATTTTTHSYTPLIIPIVGLTLQPAA